jgi:hypothetical protein
MLRHMVMRLLLAHAVAVVLGGAAACGVGRGGCTDIGAQSQLLLRSDAATPVDGAVAQVCLADECSTGTWRDGQAYVPLEALPQEGSVDLLVRTLAVGGEVVDKNRLIAEVQTRRPNGPGCDPEVGLVEVRRLGAGKYEQDTA